MTDKKLQPRELTQSRAMKHAPMMSGPRTNTLMDQTVVLAAYAWQSPGRIAASGGTPGCTACGPNGQDWGTQGGRGTVRGGGPLIGAGQSGTGRLSLDCEAAAARAVPQANAAPLDTWLRTGETLLAMPMCRPTRRGIEVGTTTLPTWQTAARGWAGFVGRGSPHAGVPGGWGVPDLGGSQRLWGDVAAHRGSLTTAAMGTATSEPVVPHSCQAFAHPSIVGGRTENTWVCAGGWGALGVMAPACGCAL